MVDYVVSDKGQEFIKAALQACRMSKITWEQLWEVRAREADEARAFLDIPLTSPAEDLEEAARLLGAFAVIYTIQEIANGAMDSNEALDLLIDADLVTEPNINAASAALGVPVADIWQIFGAQAD